MASYVGVANYAIGRADLILGGLPQALKDKGITSIPASNAEKLRNALDDSGTQVGFSTVANIVKESVAQILRGMYGAEVDNPTSDITISTETSGSGKLKVKLTIGGKTGTGKSDDMVVNSGSEDVKFEITIKDKGNMKPDGGSTSSTYNNAASEAAKAIYKKLKKAAQAGNDNPDIKQDFNAFAFIAAHDMLAMFCRFFYGKLAVGYNWTKIFIEL